MIPLHILCDLDDIMLTSSRIERIVIAHARNPTTLLNTRMLNPPSRVIADAFSVSPNFAKILPGGRYILTGGLKSPDDHSSSVLSLWDLYTTEKALVASLEFRKPLIECSFVSTANASALILAVVSGGR